MAEQTQLEQARAELGEMRRALLLIAATFGCYGCPGVSFDDDPIAAANLCCDAIASMDRQREVARQASIRAEQAERQLERVLRRMRYVIEDETPEADDG